MFGIGFPELILILVIALIIFGPGKLPEVGKAIGKSVREFKKATNEIKQEFELDEVQKPQKVTPPPPTQETQTATEAQSNTETTEETKKPQIKTNPYTTVYDEKKEEEV